jgi:6-phosphofructokinase 1
MVDEIHLKGGSILGSSRGSVDPKEGVSFLKKHKINILFCVGGDGTLRGALALSEAAKEIGYELSVIGIPKTIDNDVPFVFQSFGFLTAVEKAKDVIIQAHTEVSSYQRTLAIVKLMGREAGFIALHACLAAQLADIALIPEVNFELNNPNNPSSLFNRISNVLDKKDACVLVIAEGAGQDLFNGQDSIGVDPSGNKKLNDIGIRLVHECKKYFSGDRLASIKYFDPSYSIRAVAANVADSMLCDGLARAAVHAAFAGKTETMIGLWYNNLTHVPIKTVCKFKKRVNPQGATWQRLASTLF